MKTRAILIKGLAVLLGVSFLIYAGLEFRGLFFGPEITLNSPENGVMVQTPVILFDGKTERTKELTIDGKQTLIDLEGRFSVNLVLSPGYNIITIVATDARGKHHTVTRNIYYETESLIKDEKPDVPDENLEASSTVVATGTNNSN